VNNVVLLPVSAPPKPSRAGKGGPPKKRRAPRRRFGSIRKLPSGRFQASYHDEGGTRHVAPHTYESRADAERYLAAVETDMSRGDWIDPARLRMTLGEWVEIWWPLQAHLKDKTRDGYDTAIRCYILRHLGELELGRLNQLAVMSMTAKMRDAGLSAYTIRNAKSVLSAMMASAVANGYVRSNPCVGVKVPRDAPHEMCFLDASQVADLAYEIAHPPKVPGGGEHRRETYEDYGLAVELSASTGMRAGEQWALSLSAKRAGRGSGPQGEVGVTGLSGR